MSRHTLNDTAAQVLSALMRVHGISDNAAGKAFGKDRTWVEARRNGRSSIKLADLERIAEALELPPTVFFMDPAEAIKYSLDNPSEQGIRSTIWDASTYRAVSVQQVLDLHDAHELAGAA